MIKRRPTPALRQIFRPGDIRLPGVAMFGRYQYASSQTGLRTHAHRSAIEICFLERGVQTYRVGGTLYRLRGHDQFFTLPGELHDTADLPEERGILYWVILNLDTPSGFLGLSRETARHLKRELRGMPTRHFRAHPDSSRILAEMTGLLVQKRTGRGLAADRRLLLQSLLLQYLTLTLQASRAGRHGTASPLMQRVLHHIEEHLREPVEVPRLAQVARLSESRFKARFKREMGVPPAEFWLRKKIDRALKLLKTRNVTETAFELGFSSSQYFATAFKRYTRTSPSRVRAGLR